MPHTKFHTKPTIKPELQTDQLFIGQPVWQMMFPQSGHIMLILFWQLLYWIYCFPSRSKSVSFIVSTGRRLLCIMFFTTSKLLSLSSNGISCRHLFKLSTAGHTKHLSQNHSRSNTGWTWTQKVCGYFWKAIIHLLEKTCPESFNSNFYSGFSDNYIFFIALFAVLIFPRLVVDPHVLIWYVN